jgi:hypothetical protein
MLCTAYYALPLALSAACRYLTKSIMSDDSPQANISGLLAGVLVGLIVFLTFNLPQSPIRRWLIGTLFQAHGWKWKVYLLIFPSTVVLLLVLFHLTMSLLINKCDFGPSKEDLVVWLIFVFVTGGNFGLLYIANRVCTV